MNLNLETLTKQFSRIGARLKVSRDGRRLRRGFTEPTPQTFRFDIRRDEKGEHFNLIIGPDVPDFRVLQANKAGRHLLLHAISDDKEVNERYLCGHDERHWFIATVPGTPTSVTEAKRALLPRGFPATVSTDDLHKRHNKTFKRQGEWFFVPVTDPEKLAYINKSPILHGEELRRGTRAAKPHLVSELVRFGGRQVVLYRGTEYGVVEWDKMLQDPGFKPRGRADRRTADAEVYVRGKVRHGDHETLVLDGWHRVYVNGELNNSVNMTFYD